MAAPSFPVFSCSPFLRGLSNVVFADGILQEQLDRGTPGVGVLSHAVRRVGEVFEGRNSSVR